MNERLLTEEEILNSESFRAITTLGNLRDLLQAQDSKSYKAGAREVIEWIDKQLDYGDLADSQDVLGDEWIALKEKYGIKP